MVTLTKKTVICHYLQFPVVDRRLPLPDGSYHPDKAFKKLLVELEIEKRQKAETAREAKRRYVFRSSFYPDVPQEKLNIPDNKPKTIREVEAHIVVLHLESLKLKGMPIYDLLLLKRLSATASLENVRSTISQIIQHESELRSASGEYVSGLLRVSIYINHLLGDSPLSFELTDLEKREIAALDRDWPKTMVSPNVYSSKTDLSTTSADPNNL